MRIYRFRSLLLCGPLVLSPPVLCAQTPAPSISPGVIASDSTNYSSYDSGGTAEDIVASGKNFDTINDCFVKISHLNEEIPPGRDGPSDPSAELKTLASNSDIVIIGTPIVRQSSLTASHKFVFSDYDVLIAEILLDQSKSLREDSSIVITRPGGVVSVGGHQFRAIDASFPLFRLNQKYLFFLHNVNGSSSYSVRPSGAFLLANGGISAAKLHSRIDTSSLSMQVVKNEIKSVADERRADQ